MILFLTAQPVFLLVIFLIFQQDTNGFEEPCASSKIHQIITFLPFDGSGSLIEQSEKATINSVAAFLMYFMKQDCFGNVVKSAWETNMEQVSYDLAPLCQVGMQNIRKARQDVILFLSSPHLYIYSLLSAQLLAVSGWPDTLPQMLQDQSQLAWGRLCVFHIRVVTVCPIAGRCILRGPLRLIVAMT